MTTTTLTTAPADPFRVFRDAVAGSIERARERRITELRELLADLDRRRRDAADELARLASHESGEGPRSRWALGGRGM